MASSGDKGFNNNETIYKRDAKAKAAGKEKTARLTFGNRTYSFQKTVIIGRDKACNIVLDDPLVSRKHAKITVIDNKKFYLEDLNSTNGTYVNNNPLIKGGKVQLKKEDKIRVGNTNIDFSFI